MTDYNDVLSDVEQRLNKMSPSMCLAKWYQVTIHLQNGHTHSCHHPATHKIPLHEIAADPRALHNTQFKKERRREMVRGQRPSECDYCWRIEDVGQRSDRVYKSTDNWALSKLESVEQMDLLEFAELDINPTYVEVSFEHTCNFKCIYCTPSVSSKWYEEIKQNGAYPTRFRYNDLAYIEQLGQLPFLNRDHNPYVEAFWKWWPDLVRGLHTFRITGGEPLLGKNTFRVLDYIIDNDPNRNLNLAINSNLCVPDANYDRFIEKVNLIEGKVSRFTVFTSIDTFIPEHNEYIRTGMDHDKFVSNIERFLSEVKWPVTLSFMITVSTLSVFGTRDLVEWILDLRRRFGHMHRIHMDTPYVRWPDFLAVDLDPDTAIPFLEDALNYMKENSITRNRPRWSDEQKAIYNTQLERIPFYDDPAIQRLERVIEYVRGVDRNNPDRLERMRDFVLYIEESDRRRGTNFLEVFPEMTGFFNRCKSL